MERTKPFLILLALALPGTLLIPGKADEPTKRPTQAPNLVIDASAALVNAAVQRAVDRMEPVEDVIQETPVSGMSRTRGTVRAELIPDPYQATVDVAFDACVRAQPVASRPFLLLHGVSTTPLEVRRRVSIARGGIRELPGPVSARSMATLLEVTNRRGEPADPDWSRLARAGFQQEKHEVEAETARKTARRVSDRMGEDLTPSLDAAAQAVSRGLKEIKRVGLRVESLDFNTTTTYLQARVRIAAFDIGQPGPGPALPAEADLGVRMHQSLVNEAARVGLAGKTFLASDVSKIFDEVTQGLLRDSRPESEQKEGLSILTKWLATLAGKSTTITLAQKDPLTVVFTDKGFTVEIHAASIRSGATSSAGLRVRAAYRLENSSAGTQAVRQGPLRLFAAGEPSAPEKKINSPFFLFHELLFAEVLKERVILAALPIPASLTNVRFLPPRAATRHGWLTLAWQLEPRSVLAK